MEFIPVVKANGFVWQGSRLLGFVQQLGENWEARQPQEIGITADASFPTFPDQGRAVDYLRGSAEKNRKR